MLGGIRGSKLRQWASFLGVLLTTCRFNAIAFYLDIADMLAKEGL